MATSTYAPRASAYRPLVNPTGTNPIGFNNSTDARKVTANQRQIIQGQGDILQQQAGDLANQYREQAGGVEDYLHEAYDPMAAGQGGYNPEEAAAINLSPQEKQNMVTGAGISSGVGTAASVAAAERAAAAAGGNPMALATYRARAAQSQAANAGDSMTKARVEAKQLGSQGAQTTGAARLGQQDKALGYYGQLQGQKNQNSQNQQALQQGAFGTTVGGTNAATGDVLKASQTPSKTDKIIGGVAGVAKGLLPFLEDGSDGYLDGTDAVVGEDGPEAIIEAPKMMAEGGQMSEDGAPMYSFDTGTPSPEYSNQGSGESGQKMPFRERAQGILQNYLAKSKQQPMGAPQQPAEQWNPTTPYQQLGDAIGSIAGKGTSMMLSKKDDAGMAADGLSLQGDGPEDNGYNDNKPVSGYLWDSEGDGYLQDSPDGVMAMADGTPGVAEKPGAGETLRDYIKRKESDMSMNSISAQIRQPGRQLFYDSDKEKGAITSGHTLGFTDPSAPAGIPQYQLQKQAEDAMAARRKLPAGESGSMGRMYRPGTSYGKGSHYKADGQAPSVADTEAKMLQSAKLQRNAAMRMKQGPGKSGEMPDHDTEQSVMSAEGNNMQRFAEEAMAMRRQGPLSRYKADGQAPMPPKIVTSPTRVRLAPGDAVVPLTYRPHAKVRPSAFVNAYQGA